jgi:DNA-binding CsgD family transcriptional regulator
VDQILTTRQGGADALLQLVATRLGGSMGVLTLHGLKGASPIILTSLNMSDELASTIAETIDLDLAAALSPSGTESGGAMAWRSTVRRDDDADGRVTFLHRVALQGAIGLTVCQPGQARWEGSLSQELKGWVEPILGLLWQAEYEHILRNGLTRAIDRLDFGIVLLDADVSPCFINARAQHLLNAGDGIRRAGHAIAATDFDDTIRLQTAVRHDAMSGDGFHVLLLRRTLTRPLVAVVASLGCQNDLWSEPATALYLLDPDQDSREMISALCRAHGLTATESTLAVHLVGGATVEDAASRMHIQTQTARAYLKQVFAKTGTHRQAELVAAILAGIIQIG